MLGRKPRGGLEKQNRLTACLPRPFSPPASLAPFLLPRHRSPPSGGPGSRKARFWIWHLPGTPEKFLAGLLRAFRQLKKDTAQGSRSVYSEMAIGREAMITH